MWLFISLSWLLPCLSTQLLKRSEVMSAATWTGLDGHPATGPYHIIDGVCKQNGWLIDRYLSGGYNNANDKRFFSNKARRSCCKKTGLSKQPASWPGQARHPFFWAGFCLCSERQSKADKSYSRPWRGEIRSAGSFVEAVLLFLLASLIFSVNGV